MGAIKEFLALDHAPLEEMSVDDLRAECGGWRTIAQMIPPDVLLWVSRLGEAFRIITRKYEPKTGILTNVTFVPKMYSLDLTEASHDSIRGVRLIERKTLEISEDAVLYVEEIETSEDFEDWEAAQNLAATSLDV